MTQWGGCRVRRGEGVCHSSMNTLDHGRKVGRMPLSRGRHSTLVLPLRPVHHTGIIYTGDFVTFTTKDYIIKVEYMIATPEVSV